MNKAIFLLLTGFLMLAHGKAHATLFTVDAFSNSSTGGIGLDTGINVTAGQTLYVAADPNDLWSAGSLPRWSNADGLTGNLFATGSDESGQSAGTLIGKNWGPWTQFGLTAPYGTLVGELGGTFFTIGTNYDGPAPASGVLKLYYWDMNNGDNSHSLVDVNVAAVPEPASLIMFGLGLTGLAIFARRRPRLT
jgi:PEP-CTERM motif-containing protein